MQRNVHVSIIYNLFVECFIKKYEYLNKITKYTILKFAEENNPNQLSNMNISKYCIKFIKLIPYWLGVTVVLFYIPEI